MAAADSSGITKSACVTQGFLTKILRQSDRDYQVENSVATSDVGTFRTWRAPRIFIVETGQLPSWLPIEIRRPWNSSSQSLSTIPAFPLVGITASPTSSVRALSNSTRIVQALA